MEVILYYRVIGNLQHRVIAKLLSYYIYDKAIHSRYTKLMLKENIFKQKDAFCLKMTVCVIS